MKPSIPKGTRDFSPDEMVKRNYILDTITTVFRLYGFQQIETPAMENITTLTGKYGDEGDQLLYKVLNSRIHESKNKEQLRQEFGTALEKNINSELLTERALRYDLTVPFARYVVMHQNDITFPFKRYQVQPVWRADRPQKGRYREFFQCDADVIGSTSLLNEVELIEMIARVFSNLGINIEIKMNNRKILSGLTEYFELKKENTIDFIVLLDKMQKMGIEFFISEVEKLGINLKKFDSIKNELWTIGGLTNIKSKIDNLRERFQECNSEIGLKGISEIEKIISYFIGVGNTPAVPNYIPLQFDSSLARGLNYYTGAIFEVTVNDPASTFTSSILGGGRYDDLTGIFGLPNVSGVGISFGVDRIYDVMDELKLFDAVNMFSSGTQVLFVNFGIEEEKYCLKLLSKLRDAGINAEIYPDQAKMKKQMAYADAKKIPFVVLVGEEEIKTEKLSLKNMSSGEQFKLSFNEMIEKVKKAEA